jgi:exodeoxyribonuclease VII large subunit
MDLPQSGEENDRLVAKADAGDNAAPLSISEISALLKRTVEDRFGFVRLRGELSGVKRAASGHLYLSLKDESARIDGVMWKGSAQRLAFLPEDGTEVIATGRLTIYPGRSSYQIVIERMEIAGEGALLALLARTRARLEAEGLFDSARKRPIPFLPRVIGVVTSPTGAVIRDILHRLEDRFPTHVVVWPVAVQGQGAGDQVAAAVAGFSALAPGGAVPRPDLVIVARGGGSIEDLWAFNEEAVVRAIAASTIPVISAVGHETDTTLADYAADLRAPTPTAAAEMAVPVRADLNLQIADLALRGRRCAARPVTLGRERLEARVRHLPRPEALLVPHVQRLDDASERARRALSDRAGTGARQLSQVAGRLSGPMLRRHLGEARQRLAGTRFEASLLQARLARAADRFAAITRLLPQLDPDKPLALGFARVMDGARHTLTTSVQAAIEPSLILRFADGEVTVGGAASAPAKGVRPKRSTPAPSPSPSQGDLF